MKNSNLNELYKNYGVEQISDDEFVGDIFLRIMDDYVDEQLTKDIFLINGRLFYINIDFEENFDNIKLIVEKLNNIIKNDYDKYLYTISKETETINNILYIKTTKEKTLLLTYTLKQQIIDNYVRTISNNIKTKTYFL